MIPYRASKNILCAISFLIAFASSAAAASTPLLVEGNGTWVAGDKQGHWTGQFSVSLETGGLSGHVTFEGLGEHASINVTGTAGGMSFSVQSAPGDKLAEAATLSGYTSWDKIEGALVLPGGIEGSWSGRVSLVSKKARVSESVREALASGKPQDVFIEFDRDLAYSRVREAQSARSIDPSDRSAMRELRAAEFAAVKSEVLATLPVGDVSIKRNYDNLLSVFATLKDADALERLASHSHIESISGNTTYTFNSLTQSRQLIRAIEAYNMNYRGVGTAVAIIDSGLDWTASSIFGACPTGPDPSGATCRVVFAMDTAPDDGQRDGNGTEFKHGTNVARIVANTAASTLLIAYDAQMPGEGGPRKEYVWSAFDDLVNRTSTYDVVAVNMSFSSAARFYTQDACDADPEGHEYNNRLEELWQAGIIAVASSGNDAAPTMSVPACAYRAVSVGAVYDSHYDGPFNYVPSYGGCTDNSGETDQVTCFSNATPFLSLLAPGAFVESIPGGSNIAGTSFAAPFVTAAVAMLRGSNAFPNDTLECTKRRLRKTGAAVFDPRNSLTYPRLDIVAAVSTPRVVGDCNSDLSTTIDELILGVNIALGSRPVSACPGFDTDASGSVSVAELIAGVLYATNGTCAMDR